MEEKAVGRVLIRELMDQYIMSIDSHDPDQFVSNFADDGKYVSPFGEAEGKEAIKATIKQWHDSGITSGKRHFVGTTVIDELTSNTAKTRSTYWIAEAKESPGIVATGEYEDELIKTESGWKIKVRIQKIDESFTFG